MASDLYNMQPLPLQALSIPMATAPSTFRELVPLSLLTSQYFNLKRIRRQPDRILEAVSCLMPNTVLSAQAPTSNQRNPWGNLSTKMLQQSWLYTPPITVITPWSRDLCMLGVGGGVGHEFREQHHCKKCREGGPGL